jgi:hypothetical protein
MNAKPLAMLMACGLLALPARADNAMMKNDMMKAPPGQSMVDPDARQPLKMPAAAQNTLRMEMLERLQALQQIFQAIAMGKPQEAAPVAKAAIGMGVMMRHGQRAPEAIPRNYMSEAMMPLSRQSHMLGDQLAEALQSGERGRIDAKLAEVVGNCVACHNLFRLQ